jgi:hypothetical protein
MAVSDYAKNAATANITIGRNGSNIQGAASDLVVQRNGVAFTLVFVDATKGWIVTDTGIEDDKAPDPTFVEATGGTTTTTPCGNFKVHTFTGPGTFCVSAVGNPLGSSTVNYLVEAQVVEAAVVQVVLVAVVEQELEDIEQTFQSRVEHLFRCKVIL